MNKRFLTAMVASSLLTIGAIYAEDDCCNPCPTDCPPVCNPCPSPCYEPCYDPCYDSCEPESCCWTGFTIGADFLYWKPCTDDLEYAAAYDTFIGSNGNSSTQQGVHNVKYKHVDIDWEPGVRVYAAIDDLWCDWGLCGSYTWIKSKNKARTNRDGTNYLEAIFTHTWSTIGPTGTPLASQEFVTMDQELTYQDFNALFFTDYCLKSCHHFKPFFGVTGLFVDQNIESTWRQVQENQNTSDGETVWKSCINGYGFRFGTEYAFSICDGLKLFGNGSGAVTIATHEASSRFYKINTSGENTAFFDYTFKDEECIFVPGYHIQIGFEYDACWCGCDFGIRLGYEFLQWHNMPNSRKFSSEGPPELSYSSSPTVNILGFHGLFAGLEFSF